MMTLIQGSALLPTKGFENKTTKTKSEIGYNNPICSSGECEEYSFNVNVKQVK